MGAMLSAVVLAVLGAAVGWWARRSLRAGDWRRASDTAPLPRFDWVPVLGCTVFALVGWKTAALSWWTTPAFALFAGIALLLVAVDADVHRLPDKLTLWPLPLFAVLLVLASAGTGEWSRLLVAAGCGIVGGLAFLVLALAVPSGLGLGDVKLAVQIGLVLGWLSVAVVLSWVFLGFLVGGLWAAALVMTRRATRKTHLAFGPPLLLGALLALLGAGPL